MPFKFPRMNFSGDHNLGLYGFATESYCLLGFSDAAKPVSSALKVPVITSTLFGTELCGVFAAGNDNGIILTPMIEKEEIASLKTSLKNLNVLILDTKYTAIGNLILTNNKGCIISPLLSQHRKEIEECLGVPVESGKIGGFETVGSAALTTEKGCLTTNTATEEELKWIESVLKVKTDLGTVSRGSPFIHSALIVNSLAAICSESCTGPELGRIGEVFE
ncbi:MAG: translation initiation factor IF-6 [Candidatus Aenigmarchaeota archaeon]|nr:translation initiation factor IF-6 [Candidatus Aenigmarchaeota archaeon]